MNKIMWAEQKIEKIVVSGYKKIENTFVNSYKKIENKFVNAFLTDEPIGEQPSGKGEKS